jgi:hypothetical protein
MSKAKERPQEIINLRAGLLGLFGGLLPAAMSGNAEEKERNLLSRAIAAFVLHKEAGIGVEVAAKMVVDGGGDGGIDAMYYNQMSSTLYLVQSKYFHDGVGIPALGDVSKFANGTRYLLKGDLAPFVNNLEIQKRQGEIRAFLDNSGLKIVVLLAYSGVNLLLDDQERVLNELLAGYNTHDDASLSWKPINLSSLHDWLTHQDENQGVERVKLRIHVPGWSKTPHEMIYGKIALADVAALYQQHGESLIAGNIRAFQGDTEVNKAIAATLADQPEHFLYLNNGLTAYCGRLEVLPPERMNYVVKEVTAHRFSIVNGAQTVGVIAAAKRSCLEGHFVFIRVVSLEKMEDDQAFAKLITMTTNFQNQVQQRDLAAIEPEQRVIAVTLAPEGIVYCYKKVGAFWPEVTAQSFTSDEALVASACMQPFDQGELCAALMANPNGLWRNDDGDLGQGKLSSYHRVFGGQITPRMIWRGVQVLRIVSEVEETIAADEERDGEFYDLRSERYLVMCLVFQHLHSERGEGIYLSAAEVEAIRDFADEAFVLLNQVIETHYGKSLHPPFSVIRRNIDTEGKLKRIFETPSGCKFCWRKLLARLHSKG